MRFFKWIIAPEHRGHSVLEFKVHMLIVVMVLTSILMWLYAICAYLHVTHPSLKHYGFAYAIVHLLSLAVYRFTRSMTWATYAMLIPGGVFQTHFALLTGGFFTTTIVWVGIFPMIAGILTDKFHTLVWGGLSTFAIIFTFCMTMMGYSGYYFTAEGQTIAQFQVTFGMILLNSSFTIFLLILAQKYEEMQKKRKVAFQNLLRIMVHDIANPLTVILNMAKGLPYVKDDPPKEEYFQNQIIAQSTKMSNIIESVRWMEGLESGKKAPKIQTFDLVKIVHASVKNLMPSLEEKSIKIKIDLPLEMMIYGHPTVIENQVLTNILTNCIKFSPDGSLISIHTNNEGDNSNLFIRDQGIGIPSHIAENIFDPFYPTTRRGTLGEEGTGFGMPIALKSMEFFKGTISLETKEIETHPEDHGTCFKLSFKNKMEFKKSK